MLLLVNISVESGGALGKEALEKVNLTKAIEQNLSCEVDGFAVETHSALENCADQWVS